ncbi:MAG: hypothetical protein R2712_09735 [Vicinamibacterales bacterium]
MPATLVIHASAVRRVDAAAAFVRARGRSGDGVIVVGATRAAADELVARVALEAGGLVNVTRFGLAELAVRLAIPALAAQGLLPTAALGDEALAARAVFDSLDSGELGYFTPVAAMPGFPRALGRTLAELRMGAVPEARLDGDPALRDLRGLAARTDAARRRAGAVDFAQLLATAADAAGEPGSVVHGATLVLLDVAAPSAAEAAFVRALATHAAEALVTVPAADARTREALASLAGSTAHEADGGDSALERLRQGLFSADTPPRGAMDDSVVLFSAPGEGREAVEIARRVQAEARRGVPFDDMAILLRAPQTYLSLLEHALDRAGVPAWYFRGTRRPDPAGRALLALLACADEGLSARRFAEYVSLGQVPTRAAAGGPDADADWAPALDAAVDAIVPDRDRPDEVQPEDERRMQASRGASAIDMAGTLRAPWRWEDLLVEAAVIGGIDRWERRLAGLARDYPAPARGGLRRRGVAAGAGTEARRRTVGRAARVRAAGPRAHGGVAPRAAMGRVAARPHRARPHRPRASPAGAARPARVVAARRHRPHRPPRVCDVLSPRLSTLTQDRRSAGSAACSWARPTRRAGAASGSCSCPALPSGCSRSACARTRCCWTTAARPSAPRWPPSPCARPRSACSCRWRLAPLASGSTSHHVWS